MGLFDGFKKKEEQATAKIEKVAKDVDTLAKEVVDGLWGANDTEIKENWKLPATTTICRSNQKPTV